MLLCYHVTAVSPARSSDSLTNPTLTNLLKPRHELPLYISPLYLAPWALTLRSLRPLFALLVPTFTVSAYPNYHLRFPLSGDPCILFSSSPYRLFPLSVIAAIVIITTSPRPANQSRGRKYTCVFCSVLFCAVFFPLFIFAFIPHCFFFSSRVCLFLFF